MLFYAVNETSKKIKIKMSGYGVLVFSPGDTKVIESDDERWHVTRKKQAEFKGLTVKAEEAFKSEVETTDAPNDVAVEVEVEAETETEIEAEAEEEPEEEV